jgi:hypothetical protein
VTTRKVTLVPSETEADRWLRQLTSDMRARRNSTLFAGVAEPGVMAASEQEPPAPRRGPLVPAGAADDPPPPPTTDSWLRAALAGGPSSIEVSADEDLASDEERRENWRRFLTRP